MSLSISPSRRSIVFVTIAVLLAGIPVGSLAQTDTGDPSHIQLAGNPSYVVNYADGQLSTLQTWANESSGRTLVEVHDGWALVSAPAPDAEDLGALESVRHAVGGDVSALWGDPLEQRSWVTRVSPNLEHSVDPLTTLKSQSDYTAPQGPQPFDFTHDESTVNPSGIAFAKDANRTTMQEGRAYTGADNLSASADGDAVTVALIDTGVNTANGQVFGNGTSGSNIRIHPDSKDFIENQTVYAHGIDAVSDPNGHGTWCAAAIAANTSSAVHDGVAPDAEIMALRTLGEDGSGSTADIKAAIRYATDHGADVISMSLGSPVYDPALASAVEYARSNGVVVVIAAGNSAPARSPGIGSPADSGDVLVVGAANGTTPQNASRAYFSQFGPEEGRTDGSDGATAGATVDVLAPGMQTVARTPTTDGLVRNSSLSGTSMATPYVAGAAAVVIDQHPNMSASKVQKWIKKGAVAVPKASTAGAGHGYLRVDNAVNKAAPSPDQAEAMTSQARARDDYYRALAAAKGGVWNAIKATVAG